MTRTLAEVATEAATCTRCRLAESRTQVVFGVGNAEADLMFIGEAPGFHEDRQGEPFVGAAGQLLTRMLARSVCDARTSTSRTSFDADRRGTATRCRMRSRRAPPGWPKRSRSSNPPSS
jgi:uracil-DNA glycosylase